MGDLLTLPSQRFQSLIQSTKFIFALAIVFFIALLFMNVIIYVGPNQYGIKEVRIGVNRGIQKEVFKPGWHFALPGVSRFYLMPSDIQILDLASRPEERGSGAHRTERAAHIQTSDGFFVDTDVSILYRIVDPYKVLTMIGPGTLYVDNGVVPRAEPVLKQALGTLTTEEFYNSHLRTERVQEAKKLLEAEVTAKGIQIEQVLIRYFQYSPEIQRNIEEKKLKDQLVFKNQSEKRAATEEANLKKVVQEGEANVAIKLQEGDSYIVQKRAEQELYARKRRAEADLAVKLAEAYRTELKNTALQGIGSDYMVGLKMADVLSGVELLVLPSDGVAGVNPMNLNQTLKVFGVTSRKE